MQCCRCAGRSRGCEQIPTLQCVQDGKTDYKSVTVAEDATAQEFMDFYLDDDIRAKWVSARPAVASIQCRATPQSSASPQRCQHCTGHAWRSQGNSTDSVKGQLWVSASNCQSAARLSRPPEWGHPVFET